MTDPIWSPAQAGSAGGGSQHGLHTYEELATLHVIALILAQSGDLQNQLRLILTEMSHRLGMERGMISLIDRETGKAWLDIAQGIDMKGREVAYQPGEGITGKVAQTGRPMAIENLGQEMHFLDRTGARRNLNRSELSFLCVPIIYEAKVVGVLSADKLTRQVAQLDREIGVLSSVAELIAKAVHSRSLEEENRRLLRIVGRANKNKSVEIIGHSKIMEELFGVMAQVADSNATVLIHGETGTGKELVAQHIHLSSPRRQGSLIVVNCAAIPDTLIESELFGHEKGAFTGAATKRRGRFEEANRGTIFLDEVGELSAAAQAKLLRVLQEKSFQPLGSSQVVNVDVRVIAATNRDLEKDVAAGHFRNDLFYRLHVFPLYLPALRERGSDIILLADHLLSKYARETGKPAKKLSPAILDILLSYSWPGNVRELENVIERAILLAQGDKIDYFHLPPAMLPARKTGADEEAPQPGKNIAIVVENQERALIIDALKETGGNQTKAAQLLGATKRIIQYKIQKYEIDPWHFRSRGRKH